METIVVVDDEKEIAMLIKDYLVKENYRVEIAYNAEQALQLYRSIRPTLIILDIMMPGMDGMELCKVIRAESNLPVIMLSARQSDIDKILSLGFGADDYMSKPFSPGELVARVKAHIRRYKTLSYNDKLSKLSYKSLTIDLDAHSVYLDDDLIHLNNKSFQLLCFLAKNPRKVYTRQQLYDQLWGYDFAGDLNTVTVHIRKLRKKIEANPDKPKLIQTVWGVGYKFEPY